LNTGLDKPEYIAYSTRMVQQLNIVMHGPCSETDEDKPALNDTVAVILTSGKVRFLTITGAVYTTGGTVLYASGGEKVMLSDCYLLYTENGPSVDQS